MLLPLGQDLDLLRKYLLTALIGSASGAIGWLVGLPLPWMLGALFGAAAFSFAGVRLSVPSGLKTAARVCIGLILGAMIDTETVSSAAQWPISLLVMFIGMSAIIALASFYYIRIAGFDRLTAVAASLTGGLSNIVTTAIQMGANPPGAVIGQLLRLTAVVVLVPMIYMIWVEIPDTMPGHNSAKPSKHLWILLLGFPSFWLARLVHLPAAEMLGPLVLSAALSVAGYSMVLPAWGFAIVFVILGTGIGARFFGLSVRTLLGIGRHSAVATVIILAGSALLAVPLSLVANVPIHVALLAVVPGGVAEMAILAAVLGVDPVFVTFHQAFRSIILNSTAPLILSWIRRD
jgi:uncharacterized protein